MKRGLIACGLVLAGCSTYEGARLDPDGSLKGKSRGVPFTMTRPEFVLKKVEGSDPEQYQVSVTYVPDPMQRYSLRLSPALLSSIDFSLGFGENGGLSTVSSEIKDQIVPTTLALFKVAASVATTFGGGAFLDPSDPSLGQCFSKGDAGYDGVRARCTFDYLSRQNGQCQSVGKDIADRFGRTIGKEDKDKGQPLTTLFAKDEKEKNCIVHAADELTALLATHNQPNPGEIATKLMTAVGDAGVTAPIATALAPYVKTATDKGDVAALKRLGYAAQAAQQNDGAHLKALLPSVQVGPEEAGKIALAFAAQGFIGTTDTGAKLLERVRAIQAAKAGFDAAATLDVTAWRARYLAAVQADAAEEERKALIRDPSVNVARHPSVVALKRRMAALANVSTEFDRLQQFESRLDRLPHSSSGERISPATEYESLRKQKAELELAINTAIAATITAESKPKKAEQLPLRVPWVAEGCIPKSKDEKWRYTTGSQSPEFVVVLRRGATNSALEPPDYESPKCGAL
jgi:hypothetical protein